MSGGNPYSQYSGTADGPPSWVDTGTTTSGSDGESLTYWEEKFGGGSSSSASGPPPSVDVSAFLPDYKKTDEVLAFIRLVLSGVFIVLGLYALVRFYQSRWILDIRTRSARLVLMGGTVIVLSYLSPINESILIIWGPEHALEWLWPSLLLFGIAPVLFGSYICRALRLAVVFHPRAKRALPWLIPERNYMWFLVLLGTAFVAIPIYQHYTLEVWEIIPKQTDILATVSLVFGGILASIYPFIRNVDDLFNISTELVIVSVVLIALSIGQKCVYTFGGAMEIRWVGNNLYFVFSAIVFGISVVDPLRRLAFDPLAATKRNYADRVLLIRRARSTARTASSGVSSHQAGDSEDEGRAARIEEGRASQPVSMAAGSGEEYQFYATNPFSTTQRRAAVVLTAEDPQEEVWDFERLATTPLLAAAFEDFSRKALCHESVLFLSEVSRYQNDDFRRPSGGPAQSQYGAFCRIVDIFIKAGAREEVNISDTDKRRLLKWAHKGAVSFEQQPEEERRLAFGEAYSEVKNMLEANLLRRFLKTPQFESVRAQREKVTVMMVSPPK